MLLLCPLCQSLHECAFLRKFCRCVPQCPHWGILPMWSVYWNCSMLLLLHYSLLCRAWNRSESPGRRTGLTEQKDSKNYHQLLLMACLWGLSPVVSCCYQQKAWFQTKIQGGFELIYSGYQEIVKSNWLGKAYWYLERKSMMLHFYWGTNCF